MNELRRHPIGPAAHSLQRLTANSPQASAANVPAMPVTSDVGPGDETGAIAGDQPGKPKTVGALEHLASARDLVPQPARPKASAGQRLSLGLDFSTTVGEANADKAKMTAAIFHDGKKLRKIDLAVPADQALRLFTEIMRGTSDDGDLLTLVGRFVDELPPA